jgi:hypothetical protein
MPWVMNLVKSKKGKIMEMSSESEGIISIINHLKKTNIQMLLGVNYPHFIEYLEWLLKRDLIAASLDEEGT